MAARAPSLPPLLGEGRGRLLLRLVANGFAQGAFAVLAAWLLRAVFDGLPQRGGGAPPVAETVALVLAGLATWALRFREGSDAERLAQAYLKAVRLALFDHVNRLPSRVLQNRSRGVLLTRFVGDLNALALWTGTGVARSTVAVPLLLAALGALAWELPAAGASVAAVVVLSALIGAACGPALYRRSREERRRRGHLAASLGEMLTAASPVQVFGRGKGERNRLAGRTDRFMAAAISRAGLAAGLRAMPAAAAPMAAAAAAASMFTYGAEVSPGDLAALLLLLGLCAAPLRDLALAFVHFQSFRAARDVLTGFLALPALPGRARYERGKGLLEFRGVGVGPALRGVALRAEARSVVVVTGPCSSGKSTLLALAARLLDPEEGRVLLDGQILASLRPASLRRHVGLVSPDLPLMRGSIERNLRYRCRDASAEEVRSVLRLCDLEADLAAMPAGLATRVAEGGAGLPSGLRRRLSLARAVLGRPVLLLVDDVEAFSDARSRAALDRVLEARRSTTVIVAQDPARVPQADAHWRLDGQGGAVMAAIGPGAEVIPLPRRGPAAAT